MKGSWREVGLAEAVAINPPERTGRGWCPRRRVLLEHLDRGRKRVGGFAVDGDIRGGVRFRNGDVLLARISPSLENGKIACVDLLEPDEVAAGSAELLVLRARSELLEPAFLYYVAISPHFRALLQSALSGSTGRLRIPPPLLPRIRFALPPLDAQRRLAGAFGQLDERMELNLCVMEKLSAWQRAASRPLFLRSLPAKAGGPVHNCSGGIRLAALLHPRRSSCTAGEAEEFAVTREGVHPRQGKSGSAAGSGGRPGQMVYRHDLVFGLSRDTLNWGMMAAEAGSVSKAYQVFRVDGDKIDPRFLEGFIRSCDDYFADVVKPASREGQSIDCRRLLGKELYPADRRSQEHYAGIIAGIAEKRAACGRENAILLNLREELLGRHFSGPAGFRVQDPGHSG